MRASCLKRASAICVALTLLMGCKQPTVPILPPEKTVSEQEAAEALSKSVRRTEAARTHGSKFMEYYDKGYTDQLRGGRSSVSTLRIDGEEFDVLEAAYRQGTQDARKDRNW